MSSIWLACPYCFLAFPDKAEYKHHYETYHAKRKKVVATKIEMLA
jgi:hypothetical protein